VRALVIPVDGPPRAIDLPDGGTRFMRSLRTLIGTQCAERIWITSRWEAWLDEDGSAAGKPANQAATVIARSFGARFTLRGTVVIVGLDEDTGKPADLSAAQADAILNHVRAAQLAPPDMLAWLRARQESTAATVADSQHEAFRGDDLPAIRRTS